MKGIGTEIRSKLSRFCEQGEELRGGGAVGGVKVGAGKHGKVMVNKRTGPRHGGGL